MRAAPLAVVAVMFTGCSQPAWQEMRANPREYFNLVPPTLQSDARIDGARVTLKRGQALVVRLDEEPASGQRWEMKPLPPGAVLAPVQHDFVAKRGGTTAPDAPGDAVFRLRGVASGTQSIELEYRRPNEPTVTRTVRFDVVVR